MVHMRLFFIIGKVPDLNSCPCSLHWLLITLVLLPCHMRHDMC